MNKIIVLALFLSLTGGLHAQSRKDKLKNITKEKKTKKVKPVDRIPDDGMSSDLHTKYVGKIVWSSSEISKAAEDERQFKTNFETIDFIYGRVYMPHSARNEPLFSLQTGRQQPPCSYDCRYEYHIFVDGVQTDSYFGGSLAGKEGDWTTIQIWLRPKPEDKETSKDWRDIVSNLSVGDHTVKVEYVVNGGTFVSRPMAVGEFTLTKGTNDDPIKIGRTFADFKVGLNDPALEKDVLTTIQEFARSNGWKEEFSAVKLKNKNWNVQRHETSGVLVARTIPAYCYATWPDGHCTVQEITFRQDHDGSSFQQNGTYKYAIGNQQEVDCTTTK